LSYYRQLDLDTRIALCIGRNLRWFKLAAISLVGVVALAILARWMGLGQ